MKNIKGVLLSAGESRRMGFPKALLKLNSETVIEMLLNEYKNSNLSGTIVVLGAYRNKIEPLIKKKFPGIKIAFNRDYKKEMFSSIQTAISVINEDDAVLIGLVDYPFITKKIINQLIYEYKDGSIVIPAYKGRKGHPIIIPLSLKDEILSMKAEDHSLRDVISKHRDIVKIVEVDTDSILFDMDTPEKFEEAKEIWKKLRQKMQ